MNEEPLNMLRKLNRNTYYSEQQILLTMSSPFISKSWFTNTVTGITYSGLFKNNGAQGERAIDKLVNAGLLIPGHFIINCKKEAYAKVSPGAIRANPTLLFQLNSLDIDINFYEKLFDKFFLPLKACLNQNGIDFILQDINYVPFYHLFVNQVDFQKKLRQKIDDGSIQEVNINNNKRYITVENTTNTSSQLNSFTNSNSDPSEKDNENFQLSLINGTTGIHEICSTNQPSNDLSSDINIDGITTTDRLSVIKEYPVKINNGSDPNQCSSAITFPRCNTSVNENITEEPHGLFHNKAIVGNYQNSATLKMPMNEISNFPLSSSDEAEFDDLMMSLMNYKSNNLKRSLQDNDEQCTSSKRLYVEELNIVNIDQTTVQSSLPIDTVSIYSSLLDQHHLNDVEITNEPKQIEEILNYVQVDNANEDQWEPYNGCNWSDERMEKYLLAKERSRIYQHILLIGNPVMSKTDITRKLSNTYTLRGLKNKAIENLVTDKLLIVGDWFASCNSNGIVTLHQGYLKGYPEDNPEDKSRFCQLLSQYGIDHEAYHYSFNNGKPFMLPRKLTLENISSKNWCYSRLLAECIFKSSYLQSRIELDKDAIILDKVGQVQTNSNENHDLFEQIQRQKIMKKSHNQMVQAKNLADEVKTLINNLPSSRQRVPKSLD